MSAPSLVSLALIAAIIAAVMGVAGCSPGAERLDGYHPRQAVGLPPC